MALTVALTLIMLNTSIGSAAGQGDAGASLTEYYGLVGRYPAAPSDAVSVLRGWNPDRLKVAVGLINGLQDKFAPWQTRRLTTAAMMHTEASLLCFRERASDCMTLHSEMAVRILAKGATDIAPFTGRWATAVSRYLVAAGELKAARGFLETARGRLPPHVAILTESAFVAETFAAMPPLESPPFERDRDGIALAELRQQWTRHLADAAEWLTQAIALDPMNLAAAIHHARIEMLLGRERSALRHFHALRERRLEPDAAYLVSLFSAAAFERLGEDAKAVDAYRTALQHCPLGYAALVGLAALLDRTGSTEDARLVIERLQHATRQPTSDPWTSYLREPFPQAAERLVQLRRDTIGQ